MIDVHHHILPPYYVDRVGAEPVGGQGSSGRVPPWSVEAALAGMDEAGIRTAITSISSPGFAPLPPLEQVALARWCNDFAAELGSRHPGRFGSFLALPMPDVDFALQEVARGYDQLQADGVCLLSNYGGHCLGHAAFDPLYEELDRRGAVVFVHPTSPPHLRVVAGMSASMLEFPFDTTRTVADIVFARIPARFPRIRWIFSHAGGAIPYLSHRIDVLTTNNPALRDAIPHGFSAELKKFYFDTALSAGATPLGTLRAEVSADRIVFGSDYPFGPKGQMRGTADSIAALPWTEADKTKVRTGNAHALFPRWAA